MSNPKRVVINENRNEMLRISRESKLLEVGSDELLTAAKTHACLAESDKNLCSNEITKKDILTLGAAGVGVGVIAAADMTKILNLRPVKAFCDIVRLVKIF